MFRQLTRKKQSLSDSRIKEILNNEKRGVLSVLGDGGYPYGVPMNFLYSEKDGKIYFHSGKKGHKTDALLRCDKVSFTVFDKGRMEQGKRGLDFHSVIAFGRIREIKDREFAMEMCRRFSMKYIPDPEYIEGEIQKFGAVTVCYEMIIEHITGKTVNES